MLCCNNNKVVVGLRTIVCIKAEKYSCRKVRENFQYNRGTELNFFAVRQQHTPPTPTTSTTRTTHTTPTTPTKPILPSPTLYQLQHRNLFCHCLPIYSLDSTSFDSQKEQRTTFPVQEHPIQTQSLTSKSQQNLVLTHISPISPKIHHQPFFQPILTIHP
jgi:hypothetical protein